MTVKFLISAAAAAVLTSAAVQAQDLATGDDAALEIKEWRVPDPGSRPRDPFAVDADTVWFVGQVGDYLGRLDLASGEIETYPLPDGTGPHNLIVADDGGVWYAGNRQGFIGRFDPATGAHARVEMPDPAASDPHTLVFDADGDIWFTVQIGAFVGKLTVADRSVDLIPVPGDRPRPYGIAIAPDGGVWVALFGTNKLASIDPQTLTLTEHELPRAGARARRLEVAPDGRVWYGDYAEGYVGVFDPDTGAFDEAKLPVDGYPQPYATGLDADGVFWLAMSGIDPNRLIGVDTVKHAEDGAFAFERDTAVPSTGGTLRHMHFHAPTGRLWFGADAGTVGYAQVTAPAADD